MPRDDFSRRPQKVTTSTPQPRRGDPYGIVIPDDDPPLKRQPIRFTGWQLVALLGISAMTFLLLSVVIGANLVTLMVSPIVALVIYELWYVTFEASS